MAHTDRFRVGCVIASYIYHEPYHIELKEGLDSVQSILHALTRGSRVCPQEILKVFSLEIESISSFD